MMRRRSLIVGSGALLLGPKAHGAESTKLPAQLPDGTLAEAQFSDLLGKRRLIQLSDRPPNYASPIEVFTDVITQNDRFFVRYHMDGVPTPPPVDSWTLTVGGDAAEKTVTLHWQDLMDLLPNDVLAVCQSSGNRRGFVSPHVPGVQWPDGGMGCALWSGATLSDILKRAGVKPNALEVWFTGADIPQAPGIPIFQKSLPLAKAMESSTLVATSMNNAPLPLLNGNPARLVVPGWVGEYWVKHLSRIEISSQPLDSFWMTTAYRVPAGMFPVDMPFTSQMTETTAPITEIVVNSLIADPLEGADVDRTGFTITGIAWDRGSGISRVEVSFDGGANWQDALLERIQGSYAYRRFTLQTSWMKPGGYQLACRATANSGEKQAQTLKVNPGGYNNNVPRPIEITVR
jgi:DMSO/TMAO reductase YedYZ molybdopterin-dependent catalytic subunit